jgi:hypothetical protein
MPDPSWNSPLASSVFKVTTLGSTLVAICSTERVTVACVPAYRGTANCPPMSSGRASKGDGCTDRCRNCCQSQATQKQRSNACSPLRRRYRPMGRVRGIPAILLNFRHEITQ